MNRPVGQFNCVAGPTIFRTGAYIYATNGIAATYIYRWQLGGDSRYAAASPGDGFARGDVAFYAPNARSVAGSSLTYRPVFDWHNGTSHLLSPKGAGLEQYGYTRGEPAFYAP